MATYNSLQYANYFSSNPLANPALGGPDERLVEALFQYGKLRLMRFDVTTTAAVAASDILNLIRLPSGKSTIVSWLSQIRNTAFGAAGTTMSLGWAAYKDKLGNAVAANATGFLAATAVAAAGTLSINPAAPASGFLGNSSLVDANGVADQHFESMNGVVLTATVAAVATPTTGTLTGAFVISVE